MTDKELELAKEKQVPQLPAAKLDALGGTHESCPRCGLSLVNYWSPIAHPRYCCNCGQRIMWRTTL